MIPSTNTFVKIEVENSDDSQNQIEADCDAWAKRVGLAFLYTAPSKD